MNELQKIPDINPKWSDNPDVTLGDRYPGYNTTTSEKIFEVSSSLEGPARIKAILNNLNTHNTNSNEIPVSIWVVVDQTTLQVVGYKEIVGNVVKLMCIDYHGRTTNSFDIKLLQNVYTIVTDLDNIKMTQHVFVKPDNWK